MKEEINTLNCKTYEKMIPLYLNNTLPPFELNELLMHIKGCPSCKEELTIQFLVSEGLGMVETSDNYDLLKELDKRIKASEKLISRHKLKTKIMIGMSLFILLAVIVSIIVLIFF